MSMPAPGPSLVITPRSIVRYGGICDIYYIYIIYMTESLAGGVVHELGKKIFPLFLWGREAYCSKNQGNNVGRWTYNADMDGNLVSKLRV